MAADLVNRKVTVIAATCYTGSARCKGRHLDNLDRL
jgi:hypothetical protein